MTDSDEGGMMTLAGPAPGHLQHGIAVMFLATIAVVFECGWFVHGARAHDEHDWIRKGGYRSPLTNEWCCDKDDCVPIPASQVEPTLPGWHITPTGEVVPYIDTLPSEDGRFWRCHQPNGVRRCFFAPPGMS